MIGHLGSRVTALLDGRLPYAEEERAWEHVHSCHPCRDAVEREGWVKTQLAQWSVSCTPSSTSVREALLARTSSYAEAGAREHGSGAHGSGAHVPTARGTHLVGVGSALRTRHAMAIGGSALGVAVMGVIALSSVPANAPQPDRRLPATSIVGPHASADSSGQGQGPTRRPVAVRLQEARDKIGP